MRVILTPDGMKIHAKLVNQDKKEKISSLPLIQSLNKSMENTNISLYENASPLNLINSQQNSKRILIKTPTIRLSPEIRTKYINSMNNSTKFLNLSFAELLKNPSKASVPILKNSQNLFAIRENYYTNFPRKNERVLDRHAYNMYQRSLVLQFVLQKRDRINREKAYKIEKFRYSLKETQKTDTFHQTNGWKRKKDRINQSAHKSYENLWENSKLAGLSYPKFRREKYIHIRKLKLLNQEKRSQSVL